MQSENPELRVELLSNGKGNKTNVVLDERCENNKTGYDIHPHGDITFQGITRVTKAKFIQIPDNESASEAWRLMQEKWKINVPSLIISVTGAATDFSMSDKLSESFKSTLLKVCSLTNACIITGGKYGGVTRLVSDALEKSDVEKSSGFSCMGVANWDKIMHKDVIAEGRPYVIGSWLTQKSLNLDYKHTHFLLVKDVGRKDTECVLRGALERYIVERYKAPAVRVILNGGVNVLNTIYELVSLPNCYPIVIVQSSGRIADVVAYGLKNYRAIMDKKNAGRRHDELWLKAKDVLYDKYGPLFGGDDIDGWFEDCYERLLYCLEKKDMLFLAEMGDVDAAVMKALLTGLAGTETEAFEKMKLTLLWDRADYARATIFTTSLKVKFSDLQYIMLMSLSRANYEYVQLLMDYGVNMHDLLTVGILEFLYGYQALEDGSPLKNKVDHGDFKAVEGVDIAEADAKYRKSLSRDCIKKILNDCLTYGLSNEVQIFNVIDGNYISSDSMPQDPFWELFMWALICNLQKMALFFWPFGKNQMAKALIAAKVWQNMADRADLKEDTRTSTTDGSKSFTSLACRLLEQCYSSNEEKATHMITTTLPNIANTTCLDLAAVTYNYEYVANNSVQNLLDHVWTGDMKMEQLTTRYYMMVLLNMIFPFHVSSMIELPRTQDKADNGITTNNKKGGILEGFRKYLIFQLRTPIVTYLWHVIGYLFFLCFYSYHLTMTEVYRRKFHDGSSELIVISWVIGHLVGELFHMSTYDMDSYSKKFLRWFSDGYNKCDFVNIVLFFGSWGLSFNEETDHVSHTLHTINCALWILRFLTVLRIHEKLGLYLQMILEMLNDLLWFLCILFFVILAYSILSTSLLYPGKTNFVGHLSMFLRAWFSIYGSHFLESNPEPDPKYNVSHPGPIHSGDAILHERYLVWIIFAFYLLFTNILLLNIIIAAFNTTYERVQASAHHISKFGKYLVVVEYSSRSVSTPPPFSLIYHTTLLVRWIYYRVRRMEIPHKATKLRRKLSSVDASEVEELGEFEYFCARQVYKGNIRDDTKTDYSIQQMTHQIAQMAQQMEAMKEDMAAGFARLENEKTARGI